MNLSRHSLIAAAAALVAGAAGAQTVADGQWHGGISLGAALAAGNTSSRVLQLNADGARATAQDKISLYGLANYARTGGDTTANALRLGGRYDYNLGPSMFVFGGAEFETNKAAGTTLSSLINGGVGYHVIATPTATLDVFGGVGYSRVRFENGTSVNGAQLILGEEGAYKLSESTSLKQRFVFYPGKGDLGHHATLDVGLATAISGGWTLNTGLGVRYASKPAPGMKTTDTLLTAGFGYKF